MKKFIFLVFIILFIVGCSGPVYNQPTLIQTGTPHRLSEKVTLLPMLDSRGFLASDKKPDLKSGVTVMIPPEELIEMGRKAWREQSFLEQIVPYGGPMIETDSVKWSRFPLRTINTDLAIGFEIKELTLKELGPNGLLPVQGMTNSVILPVFGLGVIASNGHFDVAAQLLPAMRYNLKFQVRMDVLSLKGGGRILGKNYLLDLEDPTVSDREIYEGFYPKHDDGQAYGREFAGVLINDAFTWISRDPEISLIPRFAQAAWFEKMMKDARIGEPVKKRCLEGVYARLTVPDMTFRELQSLSEESDAALSEKLVEMYGWETDRIKELRDLAPYDVDKAWLEEQKAQAKLFETYFNDVIKYTGMLEKTLMTRPLSDEEAELLQAAYGVIGGWAKESSVNELCRYVVLNPEFGVYTRKALLKVLSGDLETLDNEEFLEKQTARWVEDLDRGGDPAREAAFFLISLKGQAAVDEYPVPSDLMINVLSGEDAWAGDLVAGKLASGDYSQDYMRLAGALRLERALPYLVRALRLEGNEDVFQARLKDENKIPLLASKRREVKVVRPDVASLIDVLGTFKGNGQAASALYSAVEKWRRGDPRFTEKSASHAIRALGDVNGDAYTGRFLAIWSDSAGKNTAPDVRRAVLHVFEKNGTPGVNDKLLASSNGLLAEIKTNQEALRELVDYFGQIRFNSSVHLMEAIIRNPDATPTLRSAAYQGLAEIATPEAEASVKRLAGDVVLKTELEAEAAWEVLVKEKAYWRELDESISAGRS